jgi:hypothetical protein
MIFVSNIRLARDMFAGTEHSSLFWAPVTNNKTFITGAGSQKVKIFTGVKSATRAQCYKTFLAVIYDFLY